MRGKLILAAAMIVAAFFPAGRLQATSRYRYLVVNEINGLHGSIQAYKEKFQVYPPCLGESDPEVRKRQFMEHLREVYPSSAYGVRAADFDTLNTYVSANYKVPGGSGTVALDLNRLDPAEALVFWLGGFPTPVSTGTWSGQPIAPSRLFGFNRDSDSPLKRSFLQEGADPLATRTNSRFDFRQDRLVDNDEDGWWEYVSTPPSTGPIIAPFVYFDSMTYRRSSASPDLLGTVFYPQDPKLAAKLGTVVPFAASYDPANKLELKWKNPDSFQIVCGGYDGTYSSPSTGARIELFPGGKTYPAPTFAAPPVDCDDEESDNVTNLARTTLSGDAPDHRVSRPFFQLVPFPQFVAFLAILFFAAFLFFCRKPTVSKAKPFSSLSNEPDASSAEGPRPR